MSKPTKTFIVTSSQMVEVVRKWEVTVPLPVQTPNNPVSEDWCAQALAYEIAEDREPDEKFDFVCTEVETEWSIKEQENDQCPDSK